MVVKMDKICPKHKATMIKKKIIYGYPAIGENYNDVILGGCCVDDNSPKYGYECSVGKEVYIEKNGRIIKLC